MKDLLPDNIALLEQWEAMPSAAQAAGLSQRTPRREVTSITTWAACFATYVAILGQAHPHLVADRLGYMRLVMREARRHGGQGWRAYDHVFRKNTQPGEPWARLQTSLVAAYFPHAPGAHVPAICIHCQEADHRSEDCALTALLPPSPVATPRPSQTTPPPPKRTNPQRQQNESTLCISWNKGRCAVPNGCKYRHICASCSSTEHPACECQLTPADSMYKRGPRHTN